MKEEIEKALAAATPGPWYWNGYMKSKYVDLCARHSGQPTVMSFNRWGMGGAAPSFRTEDGMKRIDEPGMVRFRQEHRKNEFVEVNHPDAHIIANAPTWLRQLLDELAAKEAEISRQLTALSEIEDESSREDACITRINGIAQDALSGETQEAQ
ncbi:hypothetical protein ACFOQM_12555 [Paenibacillus sp. GCM10012307]|uniref:Uncharacterized protein n=1 Tax=Paenibacillus roseus TaxID=2798579 RepID=A0A934MQP9_9BACL|nr:hypothetical protein [Paenibacillus roseus]MBJ6362123.1 hypothetical protein [Paenibacillus roseus]